MNQVSAWEQATPPVGLGGLGIRSAVDVAPSAYLSSAHSSAQLVEAILPESHRTIPTPFVDEAKASWAAGHESEAPEDAAACNQRAWDSIRTQSTSQRLLDNAADEEERARLLAVTTRESGAWLRALPVTALGLCLDDSTVRVAVPGGSAVGNPYMWSTYLVPVSTVKLKSADWADTPSGVRRAWGGSRGIQR